MNDVSDVTEAPGRGARKGRALWLGLVPLLILLSLMARLANRYTRSILDSGTTSPRSELPPDIGAHCVVSGMREWQVRALLGQPQIIRCQCGWLVPGETPDERVRFLAGSPSRIGPGLPDAKKIDLIYWDRNREGRIAVITLLNGEVTEGKIDGWPLWQLDPSLPARGMTKAQVRQLFGPPDRAVTHADDPCPVAATWTDTKLVWEYGYRDWEHVDGYTTLSISFDASGRVRNADRKTIIPA